MAFTLPGAATPGSAVPGVTDPGLPGAASAPGPQQMIIFRLGTPLFRWASGLPGFRWAAGTPEVS